MLARAHHCTTPGTRETSPSLPPSLPLQSRLTDLAKAMKDERVAKERDGPEQGPVADAKCHYECNLRRGQEPEVNEKENLCRVCE